MYVSHLKQQVSIFIEDVQSKSLPKWLRKELEELEQKRLKDEESGRNFEKNKNRENIKSWMEDMTDDEERLEDERRSPRYHGQRKNDTESVLEEVLYINVILVQYVHVRNVSQNEGLRDGTHFVYLLILKVSQIVLESSSFKYGTKFKM